MNEGDFVADGECLELSNEFAEVSVRKVRTRNGVRLEIASRRLGHVVRLCPLQLEALTWQPDTVFSQMMAQPLGPESDGDPTSEATDAT